MKCRRCNKEIEDKYASVSPGTEKVDNLIDYGANAENVKVNPQKNYYHRKCLKEKLAEEN